MAKPDIFDDVQVKEAELVDFRVANEGSIFIFFAETPAALQWVVDHLPGDVLTWGRNGYVVEWRYAQDILFGIENDGLTAIGGGR